MIYLTLCRTILTQSLSQILLTKYMQQIAQCEIAERGALVWRLNIF